MATRRKSRPSRVISALVLSSVGVLVLQTGVAAASPQPSVSQVRHKLDELNKQADVLVNQYDQAVVDLQAARKRVRDINRRIAADQAEVDRLRGKIATMADTAYQSGDMASVTAMLSSGDPQTVLDQVASLNHLSANQIAAMAEYEAAAARLDKERQDAQAALQNAEKVAATVQEAKTKVLRMVKQQEALLARLPKPGQPPIGGSYTGPATGSARAALEFAYAQLGKPYQWGAAGPNAYDCSGLTMRSWEAGGVNLPRTSQEQWNAGPHVSRADLQPGDLVFFNNLSHVGMYVGNGKFINAPHTGAYVRIDNLDGFGSYDGAVRP